MLGEQPQKLVSMHKGLRVALALAALAVVVILGDWAMAKYDYKLKLEVGRDCRFYARELADGSHARQPEPERQWREQYMRQYCS